MFGRKIIWGARLVLGLILVVFGLNGLLQFMPPPALPEPAARFIGALAASGYLVSLTHAVELVVGLLLLAKRFVPLALVLLAPITVNIVAFHLALAPAGMGLAALVALLNLYLLFAYRGAYEPLLRANAAPGAVRSNPSTTTSRAEGRGVG